MYAGSKEIHSCSEYALSRRPSRTRRNWVSSRVHHPFDLFYSRISPSKTRIALEFVNSSHCENVSVFWVHAGTTARLDKDVQEIAQKIGIPGCDDLKANRFGLVKEWLEGDRSRPWVLVIDNMDDSSVLFGQDRLIDQLPNCSHGSILLTTRDRGVGLKFAGPKRLISVRALETSDSSILLTHRLPTATPTDDLNQLAVVLENVPLALVQAAAFIATNDLIVAEYLNMYSESESSKLELLSEDFEDEASGRLVSKYSFLSEALCQRK